MSTIHDEGNDRVKQATPSSMNQKIESQTWQEVSESVDKSHAELTERIHQLEKEWEIERYLGVNMSTLALIGVALSYFVNVNWLLLPAVVLAFFFQHSLQGWCPPLPLIRLFKVRKRKEIEQEKYALKIIRGNFSNLQNLMSKDIEKLNQTIKQS